MPYAKTGDELSEPGGMGQCNPPPLLADQVTLSNSEKQIMPNKLLLAPLGISDLPTALGREENLDKIPNGNTFLALACLDLVKTFIATLLRFVILANSKQA